MANQSGKVAGAQRNQPQPKRTPVNRSQEYVDATFSETEEPVLYPLPPPPKQRKTKSRRGNRGRSASHSNFIRRSAGQQFSNATLSDTEEPSFEPLLPAPKNLNIRRVIRGQTNRNSGTESEVINFRETEQRPNDDSQNVSGNVNVECGNGQHSQDRYSFELMDPQLSYNPQGSFAREVSKYSGGPLIEPPDYRTNPVIEPKWLCRVSVPRSEGGGTRGCFYGGNFRELNEFSNSSLPLTLLL